MNKKREEKITRKRWKMGLKKKSIKQSKTTKKIWNEPMFFFCQCIPPA